MFDLEKSFDNVNHKILIEKLVSIGINPLIIRWIKNFLINREALVMIDSDYSQPFYPKTCVPQGSVLGPILFVIYKRSG
jgi:retron-type reverse transcriptase